MDNHRNFVKTNIAVAPVSATAGTVMEVTADDGVLLQAPPFNMTVWPANEEATAANAEIVRVLSRDGDEITVLREQEGTSARSIQVGDQIANTISKKVITDIENSVGKNVLYYGVTGDGSTDDTDAIQDAIDDVIADGGGILVFPAGKTYQIDSTIVIDPITLDSPLKIVGTGAILDYTGSGDAIKIETNVAGSDVQHAERAVTIEGLHVKGNATADAGLRVKGCNNKFRDMVFEDFTNVTSPFGAIVVDALFHYWAEENSFENIEIRNTANGIVLISREDSGGAAASVGNNYFKNINIWITVANGRGIYGVGLGASTAANAARSLFDGVIVHPVEVANVIGFDFRKIYSEGIILSSPSVDIFGVAASCTAFYYDWSDTLTLLGPTVFPLSSLGTFFAGTGNFNVIGGNGGNQYRLDALKKFNVMQYGAKADGTTDDANAIQLAINAAQTAGGGIVYLPAGTYIIGNDLAISSSNVQMIGDGTSTILKGKAATALTQMINISGTGTRRVVLKNFKMDGNKANTSTGDGIKLSTPWSVTDSHHVFEDLHIENFSGNGFYVPTSSDTRICYFNRIHIKSCDGNGFYLPYPGMTDSFFSDCVVELCALNGYYLGNNTCYFKHCYAFYNGSGGNYHGFYIVGYNQHFIGCVSQDNYKSGFYGDNTQSTNAKGATFTGCIADSNGQSGGTTYATGFQGVDVLNWEIRGGGAYTRQNPPAWTQKWGVKLSGTSDKVNIGGVTMYGNSTANVADTSSGSNIFFQDNKMGGSVILVTSQLDTDTTLAANSDSKIATQKATKAYVDQIVAANDAMVFKGVIDASANPNYPAADRGHTYRISVAGKIGGGSGTNVEVGDLIICLTDGTAAGTQAAVGANWSIAQTNIDGAVTGPASATSGNIPTYNGATGKIIQDSGVAISIDGTLASNSDAKTPTEKATKTYADTKQPLDSDLTTIAGLTATTDNFIVSVASAWASRTPAQVRTTLALVIGTNVQAWDADLDTWATKTPPSGTAVGTTDTQTLTNKRITPRSGTTASSGTPTINTDNTDIYTITALAAAITSFTTNLSGTPTEGQSLIIRIKDNGTARAITWGASFASRGATLPTTTVISKTLYVGLIWNTVTSTWDCIATAQEA